jgi:hypothetical protein
MTSKFIVEGKRYVTNASVRSRTAKVNLRGRHGRLKPVTQEAHSATVSIGHRQSSRKDHAVASPSSSPFWLRSYC